MLPLEGRSVAITGAGSGIGRALAMAFARRGAHVVLIGRTAASLAETEALLGPRPGARLCVADVTAAEGRAAIRQACTDRGLLDVLVNNAGVVPNGLLADLSDSALLDALTTNVMGPIALTRDLLPLLRRSDRPRVVNIGSVFGDIGHPHFSAYCATKFALRGFSDAIRRELAAEGIGVTYAAPRATQTPAADGFQRLASTYGMTFDQPRAVAERIVAAVQREEAFSYATGMERVYVALQRIVPALIDFALISATRKARAR